MIWTIIAAILILIGIVGTIAPLLPGTPLVLGALLIYGFSTDFTNFSWWIFGVFAALTLFSFVIDFFAPALGATGKRASRYAATGAVLGAMFGMMILGPVGIIAGPLLGAFLAEYLATRNAMHSLQITRGVFIAFVVGTAVKLGIVFAMAAYFVYLLIIN